MQMCTTCADHISLQQGNVLSPTCAPDNSCLLGPGRAARDWAASRRRSAAQRRSRIAPFHIRTSCVFGGHCVRPRCFGGCFLSNKASTRDALFRRPPRKVKARKEIQHYIYWALAQWGQSSFAFLDVSNSLALSTVSCYCLGLRGFFPFKIYNNVVQYSSLLRIKY
jgi:hypothetical protein